MKTKSNLILYLFIFLMFLFGPLVTVSAANGLRVSPARIELELVTNESYSTYLHIHNDQDQKASVHIYMEDETSTEWIKISDSTVTIQPHETESIEVSINPSNKHNQGYTNKICILNDTGTDVTGIATGIKIPINITLTEDRVTFDTGQGKSFHKWEILLSVLVSIVIILVIIVLLIRRHRRS